MPCYLVVAYGIERFKLVATEWQTHTLPPSNESMSTVQRFYTKSTSEGIDQGRNCSQSQGIWTLPVLT